MGLLFEWDNTKAQTNLRKHSISFEEATTAFADELSITIDDPLHSQDEDRLILIGLSENLKTLVVVHVEKRDNIRIISARKASKKEKEFYEENT